MIYWRFEESGTGQSGIAAGVSGGAADVVVDPSAFITKFDVDVHVAFQQGGLTKAIQGGTETVYTMGGTSSCAALASDSTNIYCRSPADGGSRLLQWPLATGLAPNTIHLLPFGNDLAVDESAQKVYFSDDPGSMNGTAVVKSAPRSGDGGAPLASSLAGGQYGPRDLVVGSSYLFWVDNHGGTYQTAAVSKSGAGSVQLGTSGPFVRFVVPDPDLLNSYWIGLSQFQVGQSTILKAFANTITTTIFRSSLDSLNGLAVDGNFVYWTQNDGRVYRALKTPSPPPKL